VVFMVDEAALV